MKISDMLAIAITDKPVKMTAKQYKAHLDTLELSIVGAAPVFGISRRQSQRIAAGDSPVPKPVAKLLRLMIEHKIKPGDVK